MSLDYRSLRSYFCKMGITTKLSSKGQVIVPRSIRDSHGWETGEEFLVRDLGYGILLIPSRPGPAADLDDVLGCTGYSGPALSIEEMDQAVSKGATSKD